MSGREQRRAWVLSRVEAGEMGVAETAGLLSPSERCIRRLRSRMRTDGPAGLVHGNRGRASPRRLPEATRERILELATERYPGVSDSCSRSIARSRAGCCLRSTIYRA
jgi:Winged helix-turn helix